jgi:hypothetical protein
VLPNDTHPEIERRIIEGYRRMTPGEKVARVRDMTIAVQQFALAGIRQRHPGISEHEARMRLAALWLDRKTMIGAFGWDPDAVSPNK